MGYGDWHLRTAVGAGVPGGILFMANFIEALLGRTGLNVLSKITGLVLSAMAAQILMGGVMGFLAPIQ
ncbi:MarC family protein [Hahella ganghwensis]|uniref:MarC family protein n=1 Tax=Hahella ganghwensis TaxID=286420 RepID=UPI0003AAC883